MSVQNTLKKVKKNNILDGILLINKPIGETSNRTLQHIKHGFGVKKAGHTGTLDPFAQGLLVLCFGQATKISGLLLDADKRYRAQLSLGKQTSTADLEGEVIAEVNVPPLSEELILAAINSLVGLNEQIPPMYSALKKDGKRLYELARAGVEVERKPRSVMIHELDLVSWSSQHIEFDVLCSKGTYVRTLGEELAQRLGTVGHLTALRRDAIGPFQLSDAHTPEQLQALDWPLETLRGADQALLHWPACALSTDESRRFCLGQLVSPESVAQAERDSWQTGADLRVYDQNGFLGHGLWTEAQLLKPRRLFVNTNKG